ncbi:MAG TPA: glycosyltransferase family A protein [Baekduia sp.]|nr:glycosyltransferase family A protein [Baekduia sp.]
MRPSFTVAIPTHDRRETVVLAARSALAQAHAPEQVLVLCDGCGDGTQAALAALGDARVEVLDLPKGPGYAYDHRNRALERARGEVIVYLADDDLLLPDHLRRIAERWSDDVDVVTTPAAIVEPDDALSWAGADWTVPAVREHMRRENTNVMASVAIRVRTARAVGGWDGTIARAADWDLWRRALESGARSAATLDPTVLHFKATGRVQAWSSRVEQNTRWLQALGEPEALAQVRSRLRALHAERAATLWSQLAWARTHAANLQNACEDAVAHAAAVEAARSALVQQHERLRADHERLLLDAERLAADHAERQGYVAELEGLLDGVRRDRDEARGTLAAIYAGRWWRLRDALRPLR